MSPNKATVQAYVDGFRKGDHAQILSCVADDVEWLMPGFFHLRGKAAFDREIENDAFVGRPTIDITRMTEENDVVVAEGAVRSARRDGGILNAVFCDVFMMEAGKVKRLTTYQVDLSGQERG
ncbi:MAG: nuclear transport factor 2 family protein [Candidatus Rokuibacteriota bacterium]